MRDFRDFLIGANYEIDWLERPEGHSWGLWRASIDKMLEYFFPGSSSNVIAEDFNPNDFMLYQNYPNPFNPSTNIQYALGSRQFVSLKVYDLLGNKIETLVNEEKDAGTYGVKFNPSSGIRDLVSGIYFYQLRAGNYTETKKMLLLK
jgi:enterochelin esterase family protein